MSQQPNNQLSLDDVIVKVTNMVSYDSNANILAKNAGYNINYVSWEDCARNKGSVWGPCISDMTLRVNNSCMPVIRKPNYSDITWDVPMNKVPIVIGNETSNPKQNLQTISLTDYLSNFSDFMTNTHYKNTNKKINLISQKENKDSHVIMSSQTCFLPIQSAKETKFNVALFNYQSQVKNPAVLVIVSTSKGTSAQIIEGKEQYLLFNNNGKKADFIGERVSDVRKNKGQNNIYDKKLSIQEKQDNVIVIVQIPLKQKQKQFRKKKGGFGMFSGLKYKNKNMAMVPQQAQLEQKMDDEAVNIEAAIVKISERTKPVCKCNKELQKYQVQYAYNGRGIVCDDCGKHINGKEDIIYHCADAKSFVHKNGFDLCKICGEKQLKFDELRGLIESDLNYMLQRDERFPVRCTLQYYKATDNGVVNNSIMNDIVKQLESSQKLADYMGSLVTEYNPNRPSEWVNNDVSIQPVPMPMPMPMPMHVPVLNDECKDIKKALQMYGGNDWKVYMKNFEDEEVKDTDLVNISMDDLKELIPKIGPRNRFKKWMDSRE
eukprot:810189_1